MVRRALAVAPGLRLAGDRRDVRRWMQTFSCANSRAGANVRAQYSHGTSTMPSHGDSSGGASSKADAGRRGDVPLCWSVSPLRWRERGRCLHRFTWIGKEADPKLCPQYGQGRYAGGGMWSCAERTLLLICVYI
jgi:hypothetical protein